VTDRFGNTNSALYLNLGYAQVEPTSKSISFNGALSITFWQYVVGYTSGNTAQFFVCSDSLKTGTSLPNNGISYTLYRNAFSGAPVFNIWQSGINAARSYSSETYPSAVWNHKAAVVTQDSTNKYIPTLYTNGFVVNQTVSSATTSLAINSIGFCWFGKSFSSSELNPQVYIDDFAIYQFALTQNQVLTVMNFNSLSRYPNSLVHFSPLNIRCLFTRIQHHNALFANRTSWFSTLLLGI
jgi:Concanavalin A-like lectin/glucanases superfamily